MTPLEVVGTVSAAAGAVTAVSAVGALIVRGERRTRRAVTRIVGDGETPGALDRLDRVEASVGAIQAQLEPDHGGSLHDVMVRIDERTLSIDRRLSEHIASPHPRR